MTNMRAAMRWDVRLLARSTAARIALMALTLAAALAVWSGWELRDQWARDTLQTQQSDARARAALLERLAAGDARASMPLFLETRLALPPPPLVELAAGRADLDAREARITSFSHAGSLFQNYQTASPVALASGRFDLGFVVTFLLPLVVIALGYGLLSEERDRRVDRLLAVHGISRWRLALARVLVRSALLAAPLLAALAAVLLRDEVTAERAWRCAAAGLVILGYAAVWWALVLVVASLRVSEGMSLFSLLAIWVALLLITPALVGALARTAHRPPSRFALTAVSRAAEIAASARAEALLGQYAHDHPELDAAARREAPAWARRWFVTVGEIDRAAQPIAAEYDRALHAQRTTVARWQLASPALVAHRALTAVAGTDELRGLAFRDQARELARRWKETMGRAGMSGVQVSAELVERRPQVALAEPTALATFGAIAPQLALLWGLALGAGLVARRRLKRA